MNNKKNLKLLVLSLCIVLVTVSACSTVKVQNGVLAAQEIRQMEKCYGKNARAVGKALNTIISAKEIAQKGPSTVKPDTTRIICGQEFSIVAEFVDNGFSDVRYVFQNGNTETVLAVMKDLYSECLSKYGEASTFRGVQDLVSDHLEDAEPSKTYVEYWSVGEKTICCINISLPKENSSEGIITLGYFENTGQLAE